MRRNGGILSPKYPDDHIFTKNYQYKAFVQLVTKAKELNADILLGGPSWVNVIMPVSDNIFWVDRFTGMQFAIIFRNLFQQIINADFTNTDCADLKICAITNRIYFAYPFLSIQKDFGYSDASSLNNTVGRIKTLYENCLESITLSESVRKHFSQLTVQPVGIEEIQNLSIPTYILFSSQRKSSREHIETEFFGRDEFMKIFVEEAEPEIAYSDLRNSFLKIVKLAIENDDDVIIVCQDDHSFTKEYSKEYLLKNIIEANQQQVDLIFGGSDFGLATPVAQNRYWVNYLSSFQFVVLFRPFFEKIINERFDWEKKAEVQLSELTSTKMLLYPFISIKKEVQNENNKAEKLNSINSGINFSLAQSRLKALQHAFLSYSSNIL